MLVNKKEEQITAKREFEKAQVEQLSEIQIKMLQITERLKENIKTKHWLKAIMDLEELNKSVGRFWERENGEE